MNVAFRTDASLIIGIGHAVRCLVLANSLREKDVSVSFVCREVDGHCCDMIEKEGFRVIRLPGAATISRIDEVSHGAVTPSWSWEEDANQTRVAIEALGAIQDWVVVDHYGLDQRWELELRPLTKRLMVIDDLADRLHDCDLLLDQNLVANLESRYAQYVRSGTGMLLGPRYALLRPIYAELHDRTPLREGPVRRLLVSFGGADSDNLTARTVAAFVRLKRRDIDVDVVLPASSVNAEVVCREANGHDNIHLHEAMPTLAPLMANADVAVGAAGTTTWERLCLGLPSLVISLAENQRPIAAELNRRGLVRWLGHHDEVDEAALANAFEELSCVELDEEWSRRCHAVVDGKGASRVCAALMLTGTTTLRVRRVTLADEDLLLEWANDPITRRNAFSPETIPAGAHRRWFRDHLRDVDGCHLYIAETGEGVPIGQVRFQRSGNAWEVHYSLDGLFRGRGLGRRVLEAAMDSFRLVERSGLIIGRVRVENHPSRRVFEALGFDATSCMDERIAIYQRAFR